jgi:hypothetical protein
LISQILFFIFFFTRYPSEVVLLNPLLILLQHFFLRKNICSNSNQRLKRKIEIRAVPSYHAHPMNFLLCSTKMLPILWWIISQWGFLESFLNSKRRSSAQELHNRSIAVGIQPFPQPLKVHFPSSLIRRVSGNSNRF